MDEESTIIEGESSRNSMQKVALYAIYDALVYKQTGLDIDVIGIVEGLFEKPYEECDYFVKAALVTTLRHYGEFVELLNANMRKWTFDRLNLLERAVYLLALSHFFYIDPEVEKKIVINVAVKQAKLYLDDGRYKSINAILDKVLVHGE